MSAASNSSSNISIGTNGIRVTQRSGGGVRINSLTEHFTRDSTPINTTQTSKDFSDIAKHLNFVEDEDTIKKIQTKREKEAHERELAFVKNQLLNSRKDDWLHQPIEELLGYAPKY